MSIHEYDHSAKDNGRKADHTIAGCAAGAAGGTEAGADAGTAALRKRVGWWRSGKGSAFIFANALGKPADRHNLNRVFQSVLDENNLQRRGVHALRHTFATNWVQHSPDIPSLARALGHTDPAFTYKTYCHADQSSMAHGMNMMADLLRQAE